MIFSLMLRGLVHGKARFACAAAGVAAACGAVVFMFSLAATNAAQAPALARRATAPWSAWSVTGDFGRMGRGRRGRPPAADAPRAPRAEKAADRSGARGPKPDLRLDLVGCTIDHRPGGHVLQGPPLRAVIAAAPRENPLGGAKLEDGRWVDAAAAEPEVVCTRSTFVRFRRGALPELGAQIKFVGEKGTMTARLVGYLAETRLPPGWPNVFANRAAFQALAAEARGSISFWREMPSPSGSSGTEIQTAASERVVAAFRGDEQRRMDYARPLLLVAAVLTALSLLVNSLLLSIEANRRPLATLRILGLSRGGVLGIVAAESLLSTAVGAVVGCLGAMGALVLYVRADPVAFPTGAAFAWDAMKVSFALALVVAAVAVLFALRPALAVRPLDALAARPRRRRHGMAVAFACGFAAFVAVEVWGASLMRAFIPSVEWPDAIVSLLPSGVSSWDVEKLRDVPGVARVSELVPRQLPITGLESEPSRNALFLAAEFLPKFRFAEGDWTSAEQALRAGDAVVVTRMMSNAHGLHVGDVLSVQQPGRRGGPAHELRFPIVGVVDLNWHMVTSRGLVRGLNGASPMTDGPVFCSLDTMGAVDPRTYMTDPAMSALMTHLWVEYEPAFLARHGVFAAGRLVEAEIARRLGNPVGATVRLHARDEIADGTLAHGSDVIGQAARVPFVFLAILALGFVAMLVADADAERRAFAVLRAVGATRGQLAVRLAGGALKTALWGILAGLPVGALAGWLFALRTGNWPGLPRYFVVPWPVVAEGTLGALVFVCVVAVPTALVLIARAVRNGEAR